VALNRPRGRPWRAGQAGKACVRGRHGLGLESGPGSIGRRGMTDGAHMSVSAGSG
jgi:hypothetical protein